MKTFENALNDGTLLDKRYQIQGVLGEGGFSITYKAYDTKLDIDVVIKEFLPQDVAARSEDTITVQARTNRVDDYVYGLERFLDEAKRLAKFEHDNISRVSNYIEAHGTAYIIMPYAAGQTLSAWFRQHKDIDQAALLSIVVPLLRGLDEIHRAHVLHRDIKPGNIYLRESGTPMLIDFGSARHALGERSQTMTAIVTRGFAPPEQYSTRSKQGPFTDLYALGAVMYLLLTRKAPAESVERAHAMVNGEEDPLIPAVTAAAGQADEWLLRLIDQCLDLQPGDRPADSRSVLDIIEQHTGIALDRLESANRSGLVVDPVANVDRDAPTELSPDAETELATELATQHLQGGVVPDAEEPDLFADDEVPETEKHQPQDSEEVFSTVPETEKHQPPGPEEVYTSVADHVLADNVRDELYRQLTLERENANFYRFVIYTVTVFVVITVGLIWSLGGFDDDSSDKSALASSQSTDRRDASIVHDNSATQNDDMVNISGGCFQMGSPATETGRRDDEQLHEVCVEGFEMARFEVTQSKWHDVMGGPMINAECPDCPMGGISWDMAQQFIFKLNQSSGSRFRLPTEAEWEYACRAGQTERLFCGDSNLADIAWYGENSEGRTQSVGRKSPNQFGLYDMTGNVWEWTCSSYSQSYSGEEQQCAPLDSSEERVLRGGSWNFGKYGVRAAHRFSSESHYDLEIYGFRLAR